MDYKKSVKILFILSLIGVVVGFAFAIPEKFGICDEIERFTCIRPLTENIAQPLVLGVGAILLTSLILLFTPERVFRAWKKFAVWAIPLGAILIIITPVQCGAALGLCFDKEIVTWLVSGAYLLISMFIIAVAALHTPA